MFFGFGWKVTGLKVPSFPGEENDLSVERIVIWMVKKLEIVFEGLPCAGSTDPMAGLDQCIAKSANEKDQVDAHPIPSVSTVVLVRVAVQCKVASDLPKLVEGLKRSETSDPMVAVQYLNEIKDSAVAGFQWASKESALTFLWLAGKSTLTDSLVAAAGIISQEVAGDVRMTDTRADEAERGITIKSTGISLYYEMSDEALKSYKGERQGNEHLINLIDSPGHLHFSSEVTAALRITDGVLLVVDCIEGVCVLRLALGERIRPVLTVNRMDRCFLELQVDGEEAYQTFSRVIQNANAIMATYADPLLGDRQVYPEKGTCAFSAGLHGWAFTLNNSAKMYASKFGVVDGAKMMERLWGENFFDPATKKWTSKNTGSPTCKRGFVQFCYEPINQIINIFMNYQKDKLWPMLQKLIVVLKPEEKELMGKASMKRVMQTWLPASSALLEMMIFHLPSPDTAAQKYRVENFRNCDPKGPLMLYVSKMMIPASIGVGSLLLSSGKVSTGLRVRIMGPNYLPNLLVEGLKRLAKSNPMVVCTIEESGEHIVAGELQLEICLKDLEEDFMGGAGIIKSDPVVSLRKIVIQKSCRTVISKSPHKHSRLCIEARPMEDSLDDEAIDEGRIGPTDDPKARSKILSEEFGDQDHQVIPIPHCQETYLWHMVEIQAPESALGGIYSVLNQKRGHVFEEMLGGNIRAGLFDHWDLFNSDPLEAADSQAAKLVADIRRRKGLKEQMTPLSEFEDK
ncbi:hypothetical protein Tsubulata_012450, partial [Turnera subulata]